MEQGTGNGAWKFLRPNTGAFHYWLREMEGSNSLSTIWKERGKKENKKK
jgi:DNA-binding PadR family transcriptional regulator